MRNYFIDDEKNEFVVDLHRTVVHNSNLVEFTFFLLERNKLAYIVKPPSMNETIPI